MEYKKVINGYNICAEDAKGTDREEGLKDITITYLCDNNYFAESTYRKVPKKKFEQIEEKLLDNIMYNLTVEQQCQAIALPTLIFQIEDIIYNRK